MRHVPGRRVVSWGRLVRPLLHILVLALVLIQGSGQTWLGAAACVGSCDEDDFDGDCDCPPACHGCACDARSPATPTPPPPPTAAPPPPTRGARFAESDALPPAPEPGEILHVPIDARC